MRTSVVGLLLALPLYFTTLAKAEEDSTLIALAKNMIREQKEFALNISTHEEISDADRQVVKDRYERVFDGAIACRRVYKIRILGGLCSQEQYQRLKDVIVSLAFENRQYDQAEITFTAGEVIRTQSGFVVVRIFGKGSMGNSQVSLEWWVGCYPDTCKFEDVSVSGFRLLALAAERLGIPP